MNTELNGICPYFTMYPLDFPLRILSQQKEKDAWVCDPFCGRGTTNFAARLCGLPSIGFDSSPVAVAIAAAKLADTAFERVVNCAELILSGAPDPAHIPIGEFWQWGFSTTTLIQICRLREELLRACHTPERIMLRAILLGALHGPRMKRLPSYLSNQCLRTFAPKPLYAARFWKDRHLTPPIIDVLGVVFRRAERYLSKEIPTVAGRIRQADSRASFEEIAGELCSWVITSPPYYGMRTYMPDQWLRYWFVGGPDSVDYGQRITDFDHSSPEEFSNQLKKVWKNTAMICRDRAKLVCRFGGVHERKHDPLEILKASFEDTGWRLTTIKPAGTALDGYRQAKQFGDHQKKRPREEYDVYARLAA
jgi:hypothetical protein